MAVQLRDMTKWIALSQTEFALVSSDVGHPLYDVPRRKLYFFHYGTYSTERITGRLQPTQELSIATERKGSLSEEDF
jgi:hypothetical protein